MLAEPRVLPVVLVSEDRVLRLPHQLAVLPCAVMGARAGDVAVQEDAELHQALPLQTCTIHTTLLSYATRRLRPSKGEPGDHRHRHALRAGEVLARRPPQ